MRGQNADNNLFQQKRSATPTLYLPIGIPGCGKSTWAVTLPHCNLISTDQIRRKLMGSLVAANQPEVQKIVNEQVFTQFHDEIEASLGSGKNTIADATNLYEEGRQTLIDIAQKTNARIEVVLFTDTSRAEKQNMQRDKDAQVPEEVMKKMKELFVDTCLLVEIVERKNYSKITRL